MKLFFTTLLLLSGFTNVILAQQNLQGRAIGKSGKPLKFATLSVLKSEDSTLAFFAISNASGVFEIKGVKEGEYLFQAAMMGYKTYYRKLLVPMANGGDIGTLILDSRDVAMDEVEIVAEKIPMLINNDTIDYNAAAFKTKPDANVEALLKKLPGVEVDRAGNIKAQGETVNKVFVDGKEFFGNDPKVATRNLPADAIKKVQVFDKKSDMSEFSGIDDGSRERSINLKLKKDRKEGYFGNVLAGGGSNERYKASGKLYKFRPKSQFAVMGMINNINRSGFSFSDYLNFSGGIQSLMSGGGGSMQLDGNSIPVDFGQPVNGIVNSGAGGVNYSYEPKRNKRLSISYMGNGAHKRQKETTYAQNFTTAQDYETNSNRNQNTDNFTHRLNMNIRNDIDSQSQIRFGLSGTTSQNKFTSNSTSTSDVEDIIFNRQTADQIDNGTAFNSNSNVSFINRSKDNKNVFNLSVNGSYRSNISETDWNNVTSFLGQANNIINNQYRDDQLQDYNYGGSISWSRFLGKGYYLSPAISIGFDNEQLTRKQGSLQVGLDVIDTLSPEYKRTYNFVRPGLTIRKASKKIQYNAGLRYEQGSLGQTLNGIKSIKRNYGFVLPSAMWRNQYARGKHINLSYTTRIVAPAYSQLMDAPVMNSPLNLQRGNSNLLPEYKHSTRAGWMLYDQFTFTSFFASISGSYTKNKVARSLTIKPDLSQINTYVNVPDDYNASANINFGRPIRKLGINTNVSFSENFNRGITLVNGIQNTTTGFTHNFRVKVEKRKNEKLSVEAGAGISLTDVKYSVQQNMNNVYYNINGFSEISFQPNEHWNFMVAADITQYNAQSFQDAVTIPLVRCEMSYYFLKANRGVLTFEGFDLLNQNKGLQRISQQNYLAEVRSNIIGQYFMLSFKYRITKSGKSKNAMMFDDIKVDMR